ncbi:MAG: thiamine pyrophosphate-dependent enzyme [Streptosporangiaceae bacterium]
MNGAQALIGSLVGAGVDVCFMNPGTSEMHFVSALDSVPEMRGVLALFEGVATGAADGYARIAGRPAAVLLHLGPGLANGLANLHLLTLTGGSIGFGLPVATGAAIAAPDRPVVSLEADGSTLYTIQALWTQARERLDVTTVLINNAAYAILRMELARTAAGQAGPRAARMLDLSGPTPDFTQISAGLGVPAVRVATAEDLDAELRRAYAEPGPHLIEAIVPPVVPPPSGTAW